MYSTLPSSDSGTRRGIEGEERSEESGEGVCERVDVPHEDGFGEGGREMRESHGLGTRGLSDSDSPNIFELVKFLTVTVDDFELGLAGVVYSNDHCLMCIPVLSIGGLDGVHGEARDFKSFCGEVRVRMTRMDERFESPLYFYSRFTGPMSSSRNSLRFLITSTG